MAGSSKDMIDSLVAKFHAISDLYDTFKNENGMLRERLTLREQELKSLQERYEALEKKYNNLKLSKTVAAQEGSNTEETKARFAKFVREIDKCISLLNE